MAAMRKLWDGLDPSAPPSLRWVRRPSSVRVTLLPGAFDPPTLAHQALLEAAVRRTGASGAFCVTRVQLARPDDTLLEPVERLELLDALAAATGHGLCVVNRGTYLEIARATRSAGMEPTFVIGADKVAQLRDPRFYADGPDGVEATFREATFLVVARGPEAVPEGLEVCPVQEVFADPRLAAISATQVRRRVRAGEQVSDMVPPVVGTVLEGYTRRAKSR